MYNPRATFGDWGCSTSFGKWSLFLFYSSKLKKKNCHREGQISEKKEEDQKIGNGRDAHPPPHRRATMALILPHITGEKRNHAQIQDLSITVTPLNTQHRVDGTESSVLCFQEGKPKQEASGISLWMAPAAMDLHPQVFRW